MADKGRQLTDKELNSLEQKLSKQYATEQRRLKRKIEISLLKFNVMDKSRRLLVDNGLMDETAYKEWRQKELAHGRATNKLIDDISRSMLDINKRSAESINKSNSKVYRDNYKQVLKEVGVKQKAKDGLFPKARINEQKDLLWNKQKLSSMLMQSISRGEDVGQIAKRMSAITDMNLNSAIRSARTLTTGTENSAILESLREARDAGVSVKKAWVTIIDERTRVSHRSLNGEVREIDERFSNGLLYPGDPDGEPREVFNCRCKLKGIVGDATPKEWIEAGLSNESWDALPDDRKNLYLSVIRRRSEGLYNIELDEKHKRLRHYAMELPYQEYEMVRHAMNERLKKDELEDYNIRFEPIGDHWYTVFVFGFDDYYVIDKAKIE